jgi:hypothetical protein
MEASPIVHQHPVLGTGLPPDQCGDWPGGVIESLPIAASPEASREVSRIARLLHRLRWAVAIVTVAAVVYITVRAVLPSSLVIDWVGLTIRLVLLGCIGWLIETYIEIRLTPWRFLD